MNLEILVALDKIDPRYEEAALKDKHSIDLCLQTGSVRLMTIANAKCNAFL